MKKKLLLTGSAGFIPSNFLRKAIYEKAPYTFVSIDKLAKNTQSLNDMYFNKDHTFYLGDICDEHFLNLVFEHEKPDIVLHMAAESAVDASITGPNIFVKSNILGTQNIINMCLKHNVEKLVYSGTDEEYGHLTNDNEAAWTEESPIAPRNTYSSTKAAGSLLIQAAAQTHGLKYNITRSCNNYGPRQTCDKLIPRVVKCILNKEPIPVYGKGLNTRSWIHVYDNCYAILKILECSKDNEIYNIGTNQELSNIEVVQRICNVMKDGHSLISFVEDRKGHDFRYAVDASKLRKLGWEPNYKFNDGLAETVDWYVKNKNWALK